MRPLHYIYLLSILFFVIGCTPTNDLEQKISSLEKKIDVMSSRCAERKETLDPDTDKSITRTEYHTRLHDIFSEQINALDSNGDMRISKSELKTLKKSITLFGVYDLDNDGFITEEEFIKRFDSRFSDADRNGDERIDISDIGLLDLNNDGDIQINEYRETIDKFLEESNGKNSTKGYGYNCPGSSPHTICDASCIRCISLWIPFWGGLGVAPGEDPCAGVCCDPWDENCDLWNRCCSAFH